MQKKKVEIIRFLIVFCLFMTACSANNGSLLNSSVPSPVEVNASTEESITNGSRQQSISDGITSDKINISKITPNEALCIAKVVIDGNTSYVIELSEKSGGSLVHRIKPI